MLNYVFTVQQCDPWIVLSSPLSRFIWAAARSHAASAVRRETWICFLNILICLSVIYEICPANDVNQEDNLKDFSWIHWTQIVSTSTCISTTIINIFMISFFISAIFGLCRQQTLAESMCKFITLPLVPRPAICQEHFSAWRQRKTTAANNNILAVSP